jgi:hypothetical protein
MVERVESGNGYSVECDELLTAFGAAARPPGVAGARGGIIRCPILEQP